MVLSELSNSLFLEVRRRFYNQRIVGYPMCKMCFCLVGDLVDHAEYHKLFSIDKNEIIRFRCTECWHFHQTIEHCGAVGSHPEHRTLGTRCYCGGDGYDDGDA